MGNDESRTFSTKNGEFSARIQAKKFMDGRKQFAKIAKSDRKFNIRVKQDDIHLFDALAKKEGVTRSSLINGILHEIMLDELMSIEDLDARTLLADQVDELVLYDPLTQPWVFDALSQDFHFILNNVLKLGNVSGQPPDMDLPAGYKLTEEDYRSPTYMCLHDKLNGLMK